MSVHRAEIQKTAGYGLRAADYGLRTADCGRRVIMWALALVSLAASACGDLPTDLAPRAPVGEPSQPLQVIAHLRGRVDLDAGTLTFEAPGGPLPEGFSAAIYGDQNVNVRLYNDRPVIDSSGATKFFRTNVGMRNLRPHYVGDEETTAAPLDTMGIYIFFTQEPVPSPQPCPGCFARITNYDGVGTFDQPNQKYFFFGERLNPANSPLGDTTLARKEWVFETSPEARSFYFAVMIAAPFPPPHETRWKIDYTADSLPERAKPNWKAELWTTGGTWTVNNGQLNLRGNLGGLAQLYRSDPLATTQSAYLHAFVSLQTAGTRPMIAIVLRDLVRFAAVGISGTRIGLINSSGLFLSGASVSYAGTLEVQLRKYGTDSVVFYYGQNGGALQRGAGLPYASLAADRWAPRTPSVLFGALPVSTGSNSVWDRVIYEIGAPTP